MAFSETHKHTLTLTTSMANPHDGLLSSILDPSRLLAVRAIYFAWADSSSLPNAETLLHFFSNDVAAPLHDICLDTALKPLSTIPLTEMPPLIPYLPSPAAPEFPPQALGLHILLDQVPRLLLRGIDQRWTFQHFGSLTLSFARELAALPLALQPQRVQRWRDLKCSFESAWLYSFSLSTALIHAEELDAHRLGQKMIEEENRMGAELFYGVADPTRVLDKADERDTTLFPTLVRDVEHKAEELRMEDAMWRMCRVVRTHEPIIRTFGRYPYRNSAMGRESSKEETDFIIEVEDFEVCESETAIKIKRDVDAGKLTPLQ